MTSINGSTKCIPATRRATWSKGHIYLAIDVPCNATEEDVVDSIKNQVIEYMHIFEKL
jgi:hypothetical protein